MSAQHTPGPWEAHNCAVYPSENDSGKRFWDICAGKVFKSPAPNYVSGYIACPDKTVAHVFGTDADASLIAQAWLIPEMVEALREGVRAIGDHFAPNDCYATGPVTGDPFRDLVQCPACSFLAMAEHVLVRIDGETVA